MTKLTELTDLIRLKADNSLVKLSDSEKSQIVEDSFSGSKERGLLVTMDISHSMKRINNRMYPDWGQRAGVDSWTSPYGKPVILNHDMSKAENCIGRVQSVEWVSLEEEAIEYLGDVNKYRMLRSAFDSRDPVSIYEAMDKAGVLTDKNWPGIGKLVGVLKITDKDAVEKFLDGRYLTFSAGTQTDSFTCMVCGSGWHTGDQCEHHPGARSEDGIGTHMTGMFLGAELSVVLAPADNYSFVRSLRFADSEVGIEDVYHDENANMIFTDCSLLGEQSDTLGDADGIPHGQVGDTTNKAQDQEEDQKEKEEDNQEEVVSDRKYDHEMTINEQQMAQLHNEGVTYITETDGDEKMVIKVVYEMDEAPKDPAEDIAELLEILEDEKKFRVPAGAKGNAKKVLEWKKKYGSEVKGMTAVGWARARQLATQSEIPLSTVKRMAAFNRHRKNAVVAPEFKSEPWKDRGYVAWLGWGGTTGVDWAIKISAANDSDEADDTLEDAYRSSPKGKGAKTPAEPSERRKGSKKNKKGSAAKGSSKIAVGTAEASLKEKLAAHNKKHGDKKGKKVTLGMLKAVWRRGAGAFSSTHRPSMSRAGWAMARVNAFLHLVRTGSPKNPKYTTDNDLLPAGHPKKTS